MSKDCPENISSIIFSFFFGNKTFTLLFFLGSRTWRNISRQLFAGLRLTLLCLLTHSIHLQRKYLRKGLVLDRNLKIKNILTHCFIQKLLSQHSYTLAFTNLLRLLNRLLGPPEFHLSCTMYHMLCYDLKTL